MKKIDSANLPAESLPQQRLEGPWRKQSTGSSPTIESLLFRSSGLRKAFLVGMEDKFGTDNVRMDSSAHQAENSLAAAGHEIEALLAAEVVGNLALTGAAVTDEGKSLGKDFRLGAEVPKKVDFLVSPDGDAYAAGQLAAEASAAA